MQTDPPTHPETLPEPPSEPSPEMPPELPRELTMVDISQSDNICAAVPPLSELQAWAGTVMTASAGAGSGECSFALRIVSSDEMTGLNGDFAGKHKPTNVLSFPFRETLQDLPAELRDTLEAEMDSLGDIAICAEVVAAEASQQGKTLNAHWAHMLIHGVLHLRGYDHVQEEDAQAMEAEEVRILSLMGFANPYRTGQAMRGQHD